MARKQIVNFRVHQALAKHFREATREYYGRLGVCFSAAMLMFLEAHPKEQGRYIKRIYEAEVDDEVELVVNEIKSRQAARTSASSRRIQKNS